MTDTQTQEPDETPDEISDIEAMIPLLLTLPPNTEVIWHASSVTEIDGEHIMFPSGYLYAPAICEPTGLAWAWEFVPVEGPKDPTDDTELRVMPSHIIAAANWGRPSSEILFAMGANLEEEDVDPALFEMLKRRRDEGTSITPLDGWSVQLVSAVLTGWLAAHSGRTDLTATWDESAGVDLQTRQAAELFRQIQSGEVEPQSLGNGMMIHPQMMDMLLADPELAATITTAMGEIIEQEHPNATFCESCRTWVPNEEVEAHECSTKES